MPRKRPARAACHPNGRQALRVAEGVPRVTKSASRQPYARMTRGNEGSLRMSKNVASKPAKGLRVKSAVKAGAGYLNHAQSAAVRAGAGYLNHAQSAAVAKPTKGLRVKSAVRAGGTEQQHAQTAAVAKPAKSLRVKS